MTTSDRYKRSLVVGASGLIGPMLTAHLRERTGMEVITLSRRPARRDETHLSADLGNPEQLMALTPELAGVERVYLISRIVRDNYQIDHAANVQMMANLGQALAAADCPDLHVQLLHGLKWYGFNVGPGPIPAREETPAVGGASYYGAQRDVLIDMAGRQGWSWSTIRPHIVCGVGAHSPSNILSCLGTFAAILRELGDPLWFPGTEEAFDAKVTFTDADTLVEAMEFAASNPNCRNQDFNVVNEAPVSWRQVWGCLADVFRTPLAGPRPTSLASFMADKGALWEKIVRKHGLKKTALSDMGSWSFADATLAPHWDQIASVQKLRVHGFQGGVSTLDSMTTGLKSYRNMGYLP